MNRYNAPLTAIALAAAALLSACGGGGTTPDTTAPTVTISDNMPGTATGDVTFTFTFNEAVSGFTTDDITVTNGTKGAFAMASNGLSATLVVTPPSTGSGNIDVSVAAGTFTDSANNANTAAASGSQAFGAAVVNLITNGDFSNGDTGWSGNAKQVRTENSNSFNFADVATAGNAYDVNLSYVLDIPASGAIYKLTFKASSNKARTLKAGIGLNAAPWTNTIQDVNLTTTSQTFELNLTSNFASSNSRIIFDMGHDTGHVVIDDVVLERVVAAPVTPPATTALTIVNFDESTPATLDAFEGTSFAASTDGTNKVAQLTKPTSAQPWGGATFKSCSTGTIGMTPSIPFTASNQTISIRVKAPRTGVKFSLEARGDGTNAATEAFAEATNTTTDWETLTFNFANKTYGAAIDASKVYNKLSIFPNFSKGEDAAGTAQSKETADRIYLIDDVKLVGSTATLGACPAVPVSTAPTTAPTTPTAAAANVISIYSNAYTPTAGVELNPNWGQNTVVTEETIASNAVQKYANFNYQGINFDANRIDVSAAQGFTNLHVDFWATSSVTSVDVFLINATTEQSRNVSLTASSWTSVDIPLSDYTIDRSTVRQLKLVANPSGQTVYLDNIYFRK